MRTAEHKVNYYEIYSIEEMTPDMILSENLRIDRTLKECENLKNWLKEYQVQLAVQYNKLATSGCHTRITLQREKRWKEKVFYFIRIEEVYSNGATKQVSCDRFEGTERHKAIAKFDKLCKDNPHWEAVKDIKKPRWE